ncbi:PREDICTED: G patch domain and KOW motifs-containing protein [Papilio xuthus]|uniref:G patch domain and KOW motifs-containing protein n=1 Tax=Papilio xuthus TaxID=66420 RepID=A0AAJ6ZCH2_PAPXU|nr:PREDICTED: G patch domain and KOW motifs-containing protein [Papilio xuthus]
METKKISFGFLKTKKQEKPVIAEQREYIESVEENAIKIIGKEVVQESEPLIIPMKPNTLITAERLKEIAEKVESSINEPEITQAPETQNETKQNETLDQMAVRELLQEAKQEKKQEVQSLKILVPPTPVIDGQKESSLDDYEAVPIREFGMAMLRGMGWTPGKETSKYKLPNLRPKGLGLGADKVMKDNQKNVAKDNDKDLAIVKNACVKITAGKFNGCYGKVVSLDEDNGRVMVNIPVKKETVSLSEFMMQPVTKSEYEKQAKVINADSYEAYKKNEFNQKTSKHELIKNESSSSNKSKDKGRKDIKNEDDGYHKKNEYANGRSKEKNRQYDSSNSEDDMRQKKIERKRYSSNESLSSDSDRRKKKNEHHSSSDSEDYKRHKSSSRKEKKDIDKKRKGKKKKRDRDRSPSHRKHKK